MRNSEHRIHLTGKGTYVSDRLRHRDIFCISDKWKKWAKRYLNKQFRKQKIPNDE